MAGSWSEFEDDFGETHADHMPAAPEEADAAPVIHYLIFGRGGPARTACGTGGPNWIGDVDAGRVTCEDCLAKWESEMRKVLGLAPGAPIPQAWSGVAR